MATPIRNRLTFGDYIGKMVDEVPEYYLKLLAKSPWVRQREPDVYEEARRLCHERGIPLVEPRLEPQTNDEIRDALVVMVTGVLREKAKEYHPDRNKKPEANAQMAAINDFVGDLRKAIDEFFKETRRQ